MQHCHMMSGTVIIAIVKEGKGYVQPLSIRCVGGVDKYYITQAVNMWYAGGTAHGTAKGTHLIGSHHADRYNSCAKV